MESQPKPNLTEGRKKILQYANEIISGGNKASVYNGLPDSWIEAIEAELTNRAASPHASVSHQSEAGVASSVETAALSTLLSESERLKLSGWPASYELAKVAQHEGIDLGTYTREQYMQYAIAHDLAIEDTQLRVAPWQRMIVSPEAINMVVNRIRESITPENDKRFHQFVFQMKAKAATENRNLSPGVRVRQGTKDSDLWLFFSINNGTEDDQSKTHKAYFCFKDLNALTPNHFVDFMKFLKEHGFNGDVKIFQELNGQGIRLNDQVVVHGASEHDAEMAEVLGQQFFATQLADTGVGTDEVIDGKNQSYSQVLADKIKTAITMKVRK